MATKNPEVTPYHKMNGVFATRTVASQAPHLIPYLKPGIKLLDVGCGIGAITMDFAQRVPDGEFLGVDINTESIATASASAKESGLSNITFQILDVANLSSIESESFDIVHAHQVMLHLKDPVAALKEMRRIAKPNGIVSIRDNSDLLFIPASETMQRQLDAAPKFIPQNRGGRVNHTWVHQAGFDWNDIAMGSVGWEFSGPEGRRIWATGAKSSSRAIGTKMGLFDEAFYDQLERDFEEWEKNDEGRILGLDSWVVATKL